MVLDSQLDWRKGALERSLLRENSFPNEYKMLVMAGAAYLIVNGAVIFLKELPKAEAEPERAQVTKIIYARPAGKSPDFLQELVFVPEKKAGVDPKNQPNLAPLSYHGLEQLMEQNGTTALEKAKGGREESAGIANTVQAQMHPRVKKLYELYQKQTGYMKMIREIDTDFGDLISEAAEKYRIPESLIYGIIIAESGGNYKLKSKTSSAKGLMQILDGTAKGLKCGNRFVPEEAIDCGTKYLYQIRSRYREMSPELPEAELYSFTVAGYNQGPNGELKEDVRKKASFWDKKYDATPYARKVLALQQLFYDYQREKKETDPGLN